MPFHTMADQFVFHAHNHKLKVNKSNGDSDVTFELDSSQLQTLIPLLQIEHNTALKITVEIEK